jgi:hypothetical protein
MLLESGALAEGELRRRGVARDALLRLIDKGFIESFQSAADDRDTGRAEPTERAPQQTGYDLDLTATVSETLSIPVIASGGVGALEHLYDGFVKGKADAVLAASIFHFRTYTISQAKSYLRDRGVPVRMDVLSGVA